MMSSAGLVRPGIKCELCGTPFAISLISEMGDQDLAKLSDPFQAKCSMCQHEAAYPKSSVVGVGAQ